MQPPPRKGNYGKFLKNLHSEQLAKLQLKNQHECELLEDIRQFTIKRSAIEKSYSEALLKISSVYLNKKMANIPEIKMDGTERWNMWSVWQTVLEENEKLAKARLAAIEVFQQQIADEAKMLRDYKIHISKRCINQLGNVQKEVQNSAQKVDITKKSYFDEEHSAHGVRDKARDIEEKLKKKKGSFFQSITSLQKNSARVTSRKEELEEKSTGARNDYLLSLAAANAHQNRYFTVDLQTTMTTMENYVFERVADYLTLMGRTELLTCSATQNSFSKIRDQAQQLTRDYNVQCCYLFYPALKQHIQYEYEICDNDPITKITAEHDSAAATLANEAKSLASKVVRENNAIRENSRKLGICISMRDAGQRTDPNDPNGPDLETKIEDFREYVRRAETEKAKAEACLECLRIGGVNVDEWLQEAETLGVQELQRSASSISMRTDGGEHPSSDSFYDSDTTDHEMPVQQKQSIQSAVQPSTIHDDSSESDSEMAESNVDQMVEAERQKMERLTTEWDDPTTVDWGAVDSAVNESEPVRKTISNATVGATSTEPIFKCTALYSYAAQNPDELTIVENEQLEVIGEGDGDGWLRARNYRGEEGYVPHNYLDVERDTPTDGTTTANQLTSQISFSSVDYTVDQEDQETYQDSVQSPDQVSVISAPVAKPIKPQQEYCIALYDYDASAPDELTFEENQIIKILTKDNVDGWWEGELESGKTGSFPMILVELCDENGEPLTEEDEETPPPSAPPVFTPPKVPPVPHEYLAGLEEAMDTVAKEAEAERKDEEAEVVKPAKPGVKFEFELSGNKHKQYGKQYSDSGAMPIMILEPDSDSEVDDDEPKKQVKIDGDPGDFGLGCVQISVTAATPMVEDADKSFMDTETENNTIYEESEEEDEDEPQPKVDLSKKQDFVQDVANAVDQILEEAQAETEKRPKQIVKEPEEKKSVPETEPVEFEAHFEANFEANFDAAFAQEPEPMKQVVGGRASIPDELAPHQLERLQNLKESNA